MSSLASILLVESDVVIAEKMRQVLHKLSATITYCPTLSKAFSVIEQTRYDIVIVCREMTDGDGIELAEFLSETALQTKILITSKEFGALSQRIAAYEAGASDVLIKPLDMTEFKYKVLAYLKLQKVLSHTTLSYASIKLNPKTGTLFLSDGSQTHLRKKETAILTCLLRHRPKIVTKDMIIDYVWGDSESLPTHSTIDVYVRRLRTHLKHHHRVIKTARGFGYYLSDSE
ncbi:response regulator transcription factor [Candidatus Woesebacteria bacterium]|nr:response regulator transcription factor [Candidatus Woesebacteria bacterium]